MSNYSFLRAQINYDRMEDPSYYEGSDVDEVEELDEDEDYIDAEDELERREYFGEYDPLTEVEVRINKI